MVQCPLVIAPYRANRTYASLVLLRYSLILKEIRVTTRYVDFILIDEHRLTT